MTYFKHRRQAIADWNGKVPFTWDGLQIALLAAILDELKSLNGLLNCPNFLRIPRELAAIKRNTTKKKRAVKK